MDVLEWPAAAVTPSQDLATSVTEASPAANAPINEIIETPKAEELPVSLPEQAPPRIEDSSAIWASLPADEPPTAEQPFELSTPAIVNADSVSPLEVPEQSESVTPEPQFVAPEPELVAHSEPEESLPSPYSAVDELEKDPQAFEQTHAIAKPEPELTPSYETLAPNEAALTSALESALHSLPVNLVPAAPESAASLANELTHYAQNIASPDPELMEAVVSRVIERMQPKMIEIITREILRPVVEALVRRELERR
jgi:hypothetical protein